MEIFVDRFSLQKKNIVITGASSGFGHHFAGVLAQAGASVVLGARRIEKIRERVEEVNAAGGKAVGVALDVLDADSIAAFLDAAEEAFGPIDVVINNAGVESGANTYAMIHEEAWHSVMDTNLQSAWRISKIYP